MDLFDFTEKWEFWPQGFITLTYFGLTLVYILWKSGFLGDKPDRSTDYEEKDEMLPRIIPVYAEKGVGIQWLASISLSVVSFFIWI